MTRSAHMTSRATLSKRARGERRRIAEPLSFPEVPAVRNAIVDCGWGRLIFGQTFGSHEAIAKALRAEQSGQRDIAMYIQDPHVLLSLAPQELFLDPSHMFRIVLGTFRRPSRSARPRSFVVRKLNAETDAAAVNAIYARRQMVPVDPDFVWSQRASRVLTYLVAEDCQTGEIVGTVTGVDHEAAFGDTQKGSSLWALAVDPQTAHPGVGQELVLHLIEHYAARGHAYLDLSVMHDNSQAIRLYEKLGFTRVPTFSLKRKNPINEPLFIANAPEAELNPYATIIVREARRRGITVDVLDAEAGYFALGFGGRSIVCRESLSELTSAIAMSRCDDKRVTRRVLTAAGLRTPVQQEAESWTCDVEFLRRFGEIVVKPARGEQGAGVSVGIVGETELERAVSLAKRHCPDVILEEYARGEDLRIIVIDYEVVAAAVRRPPRVTGTGEHSVRDLIEKQSRRRLAATGGESFIPVDAETERCVASQGLSLDSVVEPGQTVTVRGAANLHTGGTIHDVTDSLHPKLAEAAERAAAAIGIPVVGLDFIVKSVKEPDYWVIEANERPGLANHEPQPTAERFVDLLFPQTVST